MNQDNGKKNISKHILPTSANLLGICFFLLSIIKISKVQAETIIDECIGVIIVIFLASSIFSYGSMRSSTRPEFFEKIADVIFLIGLTFLTIMSLIIVFGVI
jgi:uncharacterized membrane protein SirB2